LQNLRDPLHFAENRSSKAPSGGLK
jgi:hypothetical protein